MSKENKSIKIKETIFNNIPEAGKEYEEEETNIQEISCIKKALWIMAGMESRSIGG